MKTGWESVVFHASLGSKTPKSHFVRTRCVCFFTSFLSMRSWFRALWSTFRRKLLATLTLKETQIRFCWLPHINRVFFVSADWISIRPFASHSPYWGRLFRDNQFGGSEASCTSRGKCKMGPKNEQWNEGERSPLCRGERTHNPQLPVYFRPLMGLINSICN